MINKRTNLDWVEVKSEDLEYDLLTKIELVKEPSNKKIVYFNVENGEEFFVPEFRTYIGFFKGFIVPNFFNLESLFLDSNNTLKYEGYIQVSSNGDNTKLYQYKEVINNEKDN